MQKIILYYKFTPVKDPVMTMRWQKELCERLQLKGRIIISEHGINGTLGGEVEDLKSYKRSMNQTEEFKNIEYKWSKGERDDFPKLSIKVRDELVTLAPGEKFDVFNKSKGLRPKDWHKFLEENPDVIVLDARNNYESEIGVFNSKNLVAPDIKTFKEIKPHLEKLPKDKTILTYCTGDIRCEYLSAYMQHKGFKDVYHLDGGIVKYGESFGDDGYWDGKCYVFDRRMNIGFSNKTKDIAQCIECNKHTSNQVNCDDCNKQIVLCTSCASKDYVHCTNPTMSSKSRRKPAHA